MNNTPDINPRRKRQHIIMSEHTLDPKEGTEQRRVYFTHGNFGEAWVRACALANERRFNYVVLEVVGVATPLMAGTEVPIHKSLQEEVDNEEAKAHKPKIIARRKQ